MLCDEIGIRAGQYPKECRMGETGGHTTDTSSRRLGL
jgi:hypothetical protein